jgi:23S rRNA (uracil1939-C5)-methyltransferase
MTQTIELDMTSMAYGPAAVGRHEGWAVFVPLAAPGDRVRAEIVEERRSFYRARLEAVLRASPDRAEPPCPHFGVCGGCQWQHLSYAAQLRWKHAVVAEQLARIGGFADPPVRETLPSPAPLGYRNQAQFAISPEGQLGYFALQSNDVIPIHECPILQPGLAELFGELDLESTPGLARVALRAGADDDAMVILEMEGEETPEVELESPVSVAALWPDGSALALAGADALTERVGGRAFRVSPGSFFQVNSGMTETLVRLVMERLQPRPGDRVLDLYCGVGLFTAFLASQAGHVVGVESYASAVRDAEINLDEFDNVELYEAPVEAVLPHLTGPFEAAVLDPPRTGCAQAALNALATLGPQRIVYVSCDPPTLARDGRRLAARGYRLEEVQPLDMFPQTYHIETVSVWAKR